MVHRYHAIIETPHGIRRCLRVTKERKGGKKPLIATFGGIPLTYKKQAVRVDRLPTPIRYEQKEGIRRLIASKCELCMIKSSPCPQTGRPGTHGKRTTILGTDHVEKKTQNPCRLPSLPPYHSSRMRRSREFLKELLLESRMMRKVSRPVWRKEIGDVLLCRNAPDCLSYYEKRARKDVTGGAVSIERLLSPSQELIGDSYPRG